MSALQNLFKASKQGGKQMLIPQQMNKILNITQRKQGHLNSCMQTEIQDSPYLYNVQEKIEGDQNQNNLYSEEEVKQESPKKKLKTETMESIDFGGLSLNTCLSQQCVEFGTSDSSQYQPNDQYFILPEQSS
ncbi:unnamed protein product (macronuclear) [Paramecium tetraurelia]|uniref:Uncharacterized protein n=1 Tax=Paramecium tetraurelia TaxID=5888 RepID=A0EB17_PARTE|nr:uncharacterized protein GSPATT00025218001 [Paramecium tetraurelia]CAK92484.1 unnamed protein product [Paramecium tetraurelia]|eukprot:XP_001459881.1 hypothetical protein (macronuclear) [Paramecium tetraurelia strain d4-2]